MRNEINKIKAIVAVGVWVLLSAGAATAQEGWQTRAVLEIPAPGIVEAVVPPRLVSRSQAGTMDLTLTGPGGESRAFELYWREPVAEVNVALTADRVTMDPHKGFIWEARLPEKTAPRRLTVQLAARRYIGNVKVEAMVKGRWRVLVKSAAIFKADDTLRGTIDIAKGPYEQLRLTLSGFDQQAKKTLLPIKSVIMTGDRMGKDFATRTIAPAFQQSATEAETVIEAVLPGDGLWLRNLSAATEAQFQGSWQLGRDTIAAGLKSFAVFSQGRIAHVDRRGQVLAIDLDSHWPGKSLVLKLDSDHRYLGAVSQLNVKLRLPRLVFSADQPGRYTLYTGAGQKVAVLDYPGDAQRKVDFEASATAIETNPQWRTASLVERFQLKGAPFEAAGYIWRAPLVIDEPGYYRTALNLAAVLQSPNSAIRLVQDELQVPYIQGRLRNQTIELETEATLDPKTNQGIWTIRLPGPSDQWQYLSLHAEGIFRRAIHWERAKPGNMGWQPWRDDTWENRSARETALNLGLRALPVGEDRLRLVVDNGDNQPIQISSITATYTAPTYYFLAHQAGAFWIYGGNPKAADPRYDLSLVQNQLLAELPRETVMGEPVRFRPPGWKARLDAAFSDSGWGLYAVLTLVTLVLIGMIFKMFPKGDEKS